MMEPAAEDEASAHTSSDHEGPEPKTIFYYSENWPDFDPSEYEEVLALGRQTREETKRTIPAMYEEGIPFFTKEAIADIVTQIDACRDANGVLVQGRQILLPRIDGGTKAAVTLETGRVLSNFETVSDPLPDHVEQFL